ncbi:hypothetical protein [Curtobacterium sp. MCBA15_001]|uniref:hypothetical protein n=1 Tax=Curtobacterium sp. MCBA15_001 TaxID=1898731 RepID=UPI0008DDD5F9|nr:hypothetical protein [Curtobacterium sp. MCBA15_001]OIH96974.1 hypothetical protein BIU90_15925 [Curtobacterium sp. MCBA15_001]
MTHAGTAPGHVRAAVARHPWAGLTVWAAVVFVLAASVARAFTYPPLGSGDEPAHFDYVVAVWHLHLPIFEDGITHAAPFGVTTPVQWVSQHPPLYYLLLAPVVGPLYDGGDPLTAVMAGRAMSALMAGGVVLAAAWAAWRCFPGHRRLPGAVAIVTAGNGMLIQQGGSIYNDVLFVLLLVLACGIAGAAIRSGTGPGLATASALVGAAGMSTRLSFALWLIALVVATLCARRVQLGRLRGVPARVVAAAMPLAAAAAASGWFWLRNIDQSGNVSGRHAQWGIDNTGRVVRPHIDVALDGDFWTGLWGVYRGVTAPTDPVQWVLLLVPVLLAAAVGLVLSVRGRPGSAGDRVHDRRSTSLVVLMFATLTVLLTAVEVDYVHGGGAPIPRYALTVLPVVSIAIAAGLTGLRRASGVLVAAWAALAAVPYLSLVDLQVEGIVPHAAQVVQVAFAVSVVAALAAAVGAFLDQRHREPAPVPSGPRSFRPPVAAVPTDQDRTAALRRVR